MLALSALKAAAAPYKVYVCAIGAVLLIGLVWYGIHSHDQHIRDEQKAEDVAADAEAFLLAKEAADKEHDRKVHIVTEASHENDQELTDLRAYRDAHPLHGGLCLNQGHRTAVGKTSGQVVSATGPTAGAADVLQVPTPDQGTERQSDPDTWGMLDILASRADQISAALRACRAVAL
jgi:hypothetical protein